MMFDKIYNKIINEFNMSGDGSVFGPGSVNTTGSMQGDSIYNSGDSRVHTGGVHTYTRRGKIKKQRKRKTNKWR